MSALSRFLPQARYADGGFVGSDPHDPTGSPDQGAYTPEFRQLLSRVQNPPVAAGPAPAAGPTGALTPALGGDPAAGMKAARMDQAMATLTAARRGMSAADILAQTRAQQPFNVPMMAAAGALLAPTRTGQFGESLGNALTHGASALQHQQQADEQAALRAAQMDDTAAWREQTAQAQNTRANAYADNVQNMAQHRQTMANLKAAGLDQAQRIAVMKAQLQREGYDETTQRAIITALIRADASDYRTDAQSGLGYDRLAHDRDKLEAQRAHWLRSDAAAAERARLSQLGINTRMIDSAMLAASKDIGVITGKKEPGPVIDKWLQEALRQRDNVGGDGSGGGGGAAAPAPGDAREGGERGAPGSPRGLRAATPQEDQQAAAWLQQYGDTPEKRRYLADQMRQRGVKWGP